MKFNQEVVEVLLDGEKKIIKKKKHISRPEIDVNILFCFDICSPSFLISLLDQESEVSNSPASPVGVGREKGLAL